LQAPLLGLPVPRVLGSGDRCNDGAEDAKVHSNDDGRVRNLPVPPRRAQVSCDQILYTLHTRAFLATDVLFHFSPIILYRASFRVPYPATDSHYPCRRLDLHSRRVRMCSFMVMSAASATCRAVSLLCMHLHDVCSLRSGLGSGCKRIERKSMY
jgi:hypothetical protein